MNKKIILASGSPRRKELLNLIGLDFEVDVSTEFNEHTGDDFLDPKELVAKNAEGKAKEVAKRHQNGLILGVDTVVSQNGQILGKPTDQNDAFRMLKLLQGKTHIVWTGICFIDAVTGKELSSQDSTEVDFVEMTDKEILEYIATDEPMDKAGAYAIQGLGSKFISGIRGDFFNVMGLSVRRVYELWKILTLS
ncbi:MAG: nucleoside triphosphate pyrophosphatase [Candidatus Gracilibacteria bacterium]